MGQDRQAHRQARRGRVAHHLLHEGGADPEAPVVAPDHDVDHPVLVRADDPPAAARRLTASTPTSQWSASG